MQELFAWSCMMWQLATKSATRARSLAACQVRCGLHILLHVLRVSTVVHACFLYVCAKQKTKLVHVNMQDAAFRQLSSSIIMVYVHMSYCHTVSTLPSNHMLCPVVACAVASKRLCITAITHCLQCMLLTCIAWLANCQ